MPFYNFKCDPCGVNSFVKLEAVDRNKAQLCKKCKRPMVKYILPIPPASIMEMGSKYHNKHFRKNIHEVLKKRNRQHTLENVGEDIERHGFKEVAKTSVLKDGKKRTVWDEK